MKRLIILFAFVGFGVCNLNAQYAGKSVFGLKYRLNFPIAGFEEFGGNLSYRGGAFDYKYFVTDNIHVGVVAGWTGFYEEIDRSTHYMEASAYTGKTWNWAYTTDFQFQTGYVFNTGMFIKPFISFRIGGSYLEETKIVGTYELNRYNTEFSYAPEVGIIFEIPNTMFGFTLTTNFNHVVSDSPFFDDVMYMGLDIGVTIATTPYRGKPKDL
jgi:hypothetical protein